MEYNMIFAGFGGQGILLAGQFIAEAGMNNGKNVTWMPSYGPEMRGGFANCSVVVSDDVIGTPIIANPDILIAMNQPSLDLFGPKVVGGGTIIYNSDLCKDVPNLEHVKLIGINCNEIATNLGQPKAVNMPILGALLEITDFLTEADLKEVMTKKFGTSRPHIIENNLKAISIGRNLATR